MLVSRIFAVKRLCGGNYLRSHIRERIGWKLLKQIRIHRLLLFHFLSFFFASIIVDAILFPFLLRDMKDTQQRRRDIMFGLMLSISPCFQGFRITNTIIPRWLLLCKSSVRVSLVRQDGGVRRWYRLHEVLSFLASLANCIALRVFRRLSWKLLGLNNYPLTRGVASPLRFLSADVRNINLHESHDFAVFQCSADGNYHRALCIHASFSLNRFSVWIMETDHLIFIWCVHKI